MLLSRRGRDGRLSLATFVRRKSAPPPLSVEDEARQLQVEQGQEVLQHAIISFGRSKLCATAALSLEESCPAGSEATGSGKPCSKERLLQAKADMIGVARSFPGELEWNIGTLLTAAVPYLGTRPRSAKLRSTEKNRR